MSLAICFLLLFSVIIINFFSGMVVEVMHSWAQFTLHDTRTCVSFVFTCFEAHIACVVLLTLLSFVFRCIFTNSTKSCIVCVSFTKDAIPRCGRSSLSCSIVLLFKSSLNVSIESSIDVLLELILFSRIRSSVVLTCYVRMV